MRSNSKQLNTEASRNETHVSNDITNAFTEKKKTKHNHEYYQDVE